MNDHFVWNCHEFGIRPAFEWKNPNHIPISYAIMHSNKEQPYSQLITDLSYVMETETIVQYIIHTLHGFYPFSIHFYCINKFKCVPKSLLWLQLTAIKPFPVPLNLWPLLQWKTHLIWKTPAQKLDSLKNVIGYIDSLWRGTSLWIFQTPFGLVYSAFSTFAEIFLHQNNDHEMYKLLLGC